MIDKGFLAASRRPPKIEQLVRYDSYNSSRHFIDGGDSVYVNPSGGVLFPGDGYLIIDDSPDWDLNEGGWSISCWVKTTSNDDQCILSRVADPVGVEYYLRLLPGSNKIAFYTKGSGGNGYMGAVSSTDITDIADGNWHFLRLEHTGTVGGFAIYWDGVDKFDNNDGGTATSLLVPAGELIIGRRQFTQSDYFKGEILGLRIDKGINLGSDVPSIVGKQVADHHTVLLIETRISNGWHDSSSNDHDLYPTAVTTIESMLSDNALLLDENEERVKIPYSSVFDFGTNDTTIEFWWRPLDTYGIQAMYAQTDLTDANRHHITYDWNGHDLDWFCNVAGSTRMFYRVDGWIPTIGQYYYMRFVRSGATVKIFIDEVEQTLTALNPVTTNSLGGLTDPVYIGRARAGGADQKVSRYSIDRYIVNNGYADLNPITIPVRGSAVDVTDTMALVLEFNPESANLGDPGLFSLVDDFESGLGNWSTVGSPSIETSIYSPNTTNAVRFDTDGEEIQYVSPVELAGVELSFKALVINGNSAEMWIGNSNRDDEIYFRMKDHRFEYYTSTLGWVALPVPTPYVDGQWYDVEVRNINYAGATYDIYVDGVNKGTCGFRYGDPILVLDRIAFYDNTSGGAFYIDDVHLTAIDISVYEHRVIDRAKPSYVVDSSDDFDGNVLNDVKWVKTSINSPSVDSVSVSGSQLSRSVRNSGGSTAVQYLTCDGISHDGEFDITLNNASIVGSDGLYRFYSFRAVIDGGDYFITIGENAATSSYYSVPVEGSVSLDGTISYGCYNLRITRQTDNRIRFYVDGVLVGTSIGEFAGTLTALRLDLGSISTSTTTTLVTDSVVAVDGNGDNIEFITDIGLIPIIPDTIDNWVDITQSDTAKQPVYDPADESALFSAVNAFLQSGVDPLLDLSNKSYTINMMIWFESSEVGTSDQYGIFRLTASGGSNTDCVEMFVDSERLYARVYKANSLVGAATVGAGGINGGSFRPFSGWQNLALVCDTRKGEYRIYLNAIELNLSFHKYGLLRSLASYLLWLGRAGDNGVYYLSSGSGDIKLSMFEILTGAATPASVYYGTQIPVLIPKDLGSLSSFAWDLDIPMSDARRHKITPYGNVRLNGHGECIFDGIDDHLGVPASQDWGGYTGITVDVKLNAIDKDQSIWGYWQDANNGNRLFISAANELWFYSQVGGVLSINLKSVSMEWTAGQWYTIQVSRTGDNQWKLRRDGVAVASHDTLDEVNHLDHEHYVGYWNETGNETYFDGDMRRLSIQKLSEALASQLPIPVDQDTVLALDFEGAEGWSDSSDYRRTVINHGDIRIGGKIDWVLHSIVADISGDYLTFSNDSDMNMGTGSFTWQEWIRTIPKTYTRNLVDKFSQAVAEDGYSISIAGNTGRIVFETSDGGARSYCFGTTNVTDEDWHHIACVRDSNGLRIYVDGVEESYSAQLNRTTVRDLNNSESFILGYGVPGWAGDYFGGARARCHLTKQALYTTNFTPPSANDPIVIDVDTILALNFDGPENQSFNRIIDGARPSYLFGASDNFYREYIYPRRWTIDHLNSGTAQVSGNQLQMSTFSSTDISRLYESLNHSGDFLITVSFTDFVKAGGTLPLIFNVKLVFTDASEILFGVNTDGVLIMGWWLGGSVVQGVYSPSGTLTIERVGSTITLTAFGVSITYSKSTDISSIGLQLSGSGYGNIHLDSMLAVDGSGTELQILSDSYSEAQLVPDSSGYESDASQTGLTIMPTFDPINGDLAFDNDDYMVIDGSKFAVTDESSFMVFLVFTPTVNASGSFILSRHNNVSGTFNWRLFHNSSTTLAFNVDKANVGSISAVASNPPIGSKILVTCTYDAGIVRIYYNGVLKGSATYPYGSAPDSNANIYVNSVQYSSPSAGDGIYDRVLYLDYVDNLDKDVIEQLLMAEYGIS